jgi:undecaprenyl-diphosphatase
MMAGFLAAAAGLVVFGYLAREVWTQQTIRFDRSVRDGVHSWATPGLTTAMRTVTWFGSVPAFLVIGSLAVWRLLSAGRRHAAMILPIALVGAELLDQILKLAFHRARPPSFFGLHEIGYSFPSGHSVSSACFYGVLAAIFTVRSSPLRRAALWTGAALLALAIGLSRIYLGVHYPSDVVAGYAAAIVWVAAVRAGYEIWLRRRRPIADSNP